MEPPSEASCTGIISIGSQQAGVVAKVLVRSGQAVKAGDLLFELDKRQAQVEVKVRAAVLAAAKAQLHRSEQSAPQGGTAPSEAQVQAAEANFKQQHEQYQRYVKLAAVQAISQQDSEIAARVAIRPAPNSVKAQADLALLKADAWKPDLDIAAANIEQAQAQLDQRRFSSIFWKFAPRPTASSSRSMCDLVNTSPTSKAIP